MSLILKLALTVISDLTERMKFSCLTVFTAATYLNKDRDLVSCALNPCFSFLCHNSFHFHSRSLDFCFTVLSCMLFFFSLFSIKVKSGGRRQTKVPFVCATASMPARVSAQSLRVCRVCNLPWKLRVWGLCPAKFPWSLSRLILTDCTSCK